MPPRNHPLRFRPIPEGLWQVTSDFATRNSEQAGALNIALWSLGTAGSPSDFVRLIGEATYRTVDTIFDYAACMLRSSRYLRDLADLTVSPSLTTPYTELHSWISRLESIDAASGSSTGEETPTQDQIHCARGQLPVSLLGRERHQAWYASASMALNGAAMMIGADSNWRQDVISGCSNTGVDTYSRGWTDVPVKSDIDVDLDAFCVADLDTADSLLSPIPRWRLVDPIPTVNLDNSFTDFPRPITDAMNAANRNLRSVGRSLAKLTTICRPEIATTEHVDDAWRDKINMVVQHFDSTTSILNDNDDHVECVARCIPFLSQSIISQALLRTDYSTYDAGLGPVDLAATLCVLGVGIAFGFKEETECRRRQKQWVEAQSSTEI